VMMWPGVPRRWWRRLVRVRLLLLRRQRLVRVWLLRRGVLVLDGGGRAPLVVLRRVGVAGVGRVRVRGRRVPLSVRVGGVRRQRLAGAGEAALVAIRVHGGGGPEVWAQGRPPVAGSWSRGAGLSAACRFLEQGAWALGRPPDRGGWARNAVQGRRARRPAAALGLAFRTVAAGFRVRLCRWALAAARLFGCPVLVGLRVES
jgi:hypothetical protein